MTKPEFETIRYKIDLAFNNLHEDDVVRLWYENLMDFSVDDVDTAVNDFIYNNNRRPTIADIVQGSRLSKNRRTRPIDIYNTKTVKCPYCNDSGLIVTVSPKGVWNGRPCTHCSKGKEKHPFDLLTPEEQEVVYKEEERQGLRPCRHPFEATKEQYMLYNYGVEKI